MSPYNSVVCGPKFTKFLSSNLEGDVVDQILFGFAMRWSVPEILAIKVEKLSKIALNFGRLFRAPKFQGAGLPKLIQILSLLTRGTSSGKSFVSIHPLARKL